MSQSVSYMYSPSSKFPRSTVNAIRLHTEVPTILMCKPAFLSPIHQSIPYPNLNHRLNRSKLRLPPLLCRLTTPSLKYLSSPVAVRPPIYHFSAPSTSRKPSLLESDSLLPLDDVIYLCCCVFVGEPTVFSGAGLRESGDVEWVRGECREVSAVVVAPGLVVVVIVRGFEGELCV